MNQKILDLVAQVRSLKNQVKSLNDVKVKEIDTSHERLAKTLADNGLIHIDCCHTETTQKDKGSNPDTHCIRCKKLVVFQYGLNLTANEKEIIDSIYKDNNHVMQIAQEMNTLEQGFRLLRNNIVKQVYEDLKKSQLISQCIHEGGNWSECKNCRKKLIYEGNTPVAEDDKDILFRILETLPVNVTNNSYSWADWIKGEY